ncbi:MAG: DUF6489 family protein [Alphaproteobacteria bacterium]
MKIHIDIDCTPAEARAFFGLPDVKPMQDHLMQDLEDRMRANLKAMDVDTIVKNWMPGGVGLDKIQQAFWSQFMGRGGASSNDEEK